MATIGGGIVLGNVSPRKRKRVTDADREYNREVFDVMLNGTFDEKVILLLRESGASGLTFDDLAIRVGLFGKHLKKALTEPLSTKKIAVVDSATQRYVDVTIAEQTKDAILAALETYHKTHPLQLGLVKEELRGSVGKMVDQKVFGYCLNELTRKGAIVQEESVVRLSTHEVALKADEEELQKEILDWYGSKGLFTPTLRETIENFSDYQERQVKEVLDLLVREGQIAKISETLYYHKPIIEGVTTKVVEYMRENEEIDAPGFKELTGLTRKFSIPILEYLDRVKVTMRIGDKRILRKKV